MAVNHCEECAEDIVPIVLPPCDNSDCNPGFCNEGCADYPPSSCIIYNGENYPCLNIVKGANPIRLTEVIGKMISAYCAFADVTTLDKFARTSLQDTTSGYLKDKIVEGTNISIVESGINNKHLTINNTFVETSFQGVNSDGIAYTAGGTHGHSPIYKVKIDPTSDGGLTVGSAGLKLVLPSPEINLTINDTPTVNLTASGAKNHTLQADVKISATSGNGLTANSDGLFIPAAIAETSFVASNGDGIEATSGGTHGHSPVYKVKLDPTTDSSLSLSSSGLKLVPAQETVLSKDDSTTIQLTLSGAKNHHIVADAKISQVAGNALTTNQGLYVPTPTVETTLVATDSSTIDFGQSGTHGHTITASVKISAVADNALVNNTGLYVKKDKLTPQALSYGSTTNWNIDNGYNAYVTLTGNTILAISNIIAGNYITLKITQDSTGSRTITLPAGSKVKSGGAGSVSLSSAANAIDLLCGYYDGTSYFWTIGKNYT